MRGREESLRERFAEQACTHCGARYPAASVLVLARRGLTWMVMARCERCQQQGIFVVSFHQQRAHAGQGDAPTAFDASAAPDAAAHSADLADTSQPPRSPDDQSYEPPQYRPPAFPWYTASEGAAEYERPPYPSMYEPAATPATPHERQDAPPTPNDHGRNAGHWFSIHGRGAVTRDDVSAMREFLSGYDGDLASLVTLPPGRARDE